ncbi:hypothetical protein REPUB_Repub17cG0024900 [Reevesia pubescens]
MESIVIDRRKITKWKNLKQRLGLKAMGCCGANWSPRARISTINSILDEDEDEEEAAAQRQQVFMSRSGNAVNNHINTPTENNCGSSGIPLLLAGRQQVVVATSGSGSGSGSGMNLAMALAAERNLRGNNVGPSPTEVKTLMRLIEETEGVDWNNKKKSRKENINVVVNVDQGDRSSSDWMCCVCMERKKGAAFIPCGHTFCRTKLQRLISREGARLELLLSYRRQEQPDVALRGVGAPSSPASSSSVDRYYDYVERLQQLCSFRFGLVVQQWASERSKKKK